MRSELWSRSSEEERKKIIELLLKNSKERIYLSLVAYKFITDKFKEVKLIQNLVSLYIDFFLFF